MNPPARRRRDQGAVTVWAVVVGFAIMAFVGLIVVDGGTVLRTRGHVFSVAGAAARTGAQALEDAAAVGGDVMIDEDAARSAALAYVRTHDADGTVAVNGAEVTVTVHDTADLRVYPGAVDVAATATASAIEVEP
jgi:hypothetical protein